jgi:hypothetical protein
VFNVFAEDLDSKRTTTKTTAKKDIESEFSGKGSCMSLSERLELRIPSCKLRMQISICNISAVKTGWDYSEEK